MTEDVDEKSPFKAFVGIDFGTDGSGLAYCLRDGTAYIHNMWGVTEASEKPKTSVLFGKDGEVLSVGSEAQDMYIKSLAKDWKLFERFKMMLYEEPGARNVLKDSDEKMDYIDLKSKIASTNDSNITEESSKVFIAQLKWLKDHAFDFIENNLRSKLKLTGDKEKGWPEIQYYLTVPAIWSDKAKDKMVEWAQEAGLINSNIKNQLKVVYEPDCASLSIQHSILRYMNGNNINNKNKNDDDNDSNSDSDEDELEALQPTVNIKVAFKPGDKYILVDTGGGTCDVACHQIIDTFKIIEVLHPSGGKWGATYIDERFIKLLGELFSKQLLNIFQMIEKRGRESYLSFLGYFLNKSKLSFYENPAAKYHDIQMPSNFVEFVTSQYNQEYNEGNDSLNVSAILKKLNVRLNEIGKQYKKVAAAAIYYGNDIEGHVDDQQKVKKEERDWMIKILKNKNYKQKKQEKYLFSMHSDIWEMLFNTIITPIIDHCDKILKTKQMKEAKYIFLVGGFAKSAYFKMKMMSSFSKYKNVEIMLPDLPDLCVVDGAARYGLDQHFVRLRRLAISYGVKVGLPKSSLDLKQFPAGYVKEHEYFSETQNCQYVQGCFNALAKKGQAVNTDGTGERITTTTYKMTQTQTDSLIEVYSSPEENPIITKNAKKLCKIVVDLPKDSNDGTIVEFCFSNNLLTVFAYAKGQRETMIQCQVEYY